MKKKDVQSVEVTAMAATGKALARVDNQVVFIDKAVPGDIADITIIRKKKNFMEAVVKEFHELSEARTDAPCRHFGICGGCKWQNIVYEQQLAYKQQLVEDNLKRIGKLSLPKIKGILPSGQLFEFRNKLEFTFTSYRWLSNEEVKSGKELDRNGLGFHMPGYYDRLVDIGECLLQPDLSNSIRNRAREIGKEAGYSFFDIRQNKGTLRNLIIRISSIGELMVILQVGEDEPSKAEHFLSELASSFPEITSLHYIINLKKNDNYGDQNVIHFAGREYIREKMDDPGGKGELFFRVSPKSFYQTNSKQAEALYRLAWEYAAFTGDELVYDLYTGAGTIACYVAHSVKKVIGIEYIEDAVSDARENASMNQIDNTAFFAGDMREVLSDEFIHIHGKPDVIITDPPRAGMHRDVTIKLLQVNPRKIIYISCNPATQARDLELLNERYKVTAVQPVDMFPHTPHVENIVVLERK